MMTHISSPSSRGHGLTASRPRVLMGLASISLLLPRVLLQLHSICALLSSINRPAEALVHIKPFASQALATSSRRSLGGRPMGQKSCGSVTRLTRT